MVAIEELGSCIDVVDVAAVDADRSEQAGIVGDGSEVLADIAVFKKNAAAGVAALDGAIRVIPLVDPANSHGGVAAPGVLMTGFTKVSRSGKAEKGKHAVKSAALVAASNDEQVTLATTVVVVAAWS